MPGVPRRKAKPRDPRLKAEAVRLVRAGELSVKQVAARFAVAESTLRRWVAKAAVKHASSRPEREKNTRDRMIAGAAALLASRGLQATSFTEVLSTTDAPRGSVYHHFPAGKDQLVKAALGYAGAKFAKAFQPGADASAEVVTDSFIRIWRTILTSSHFRSGCAVVAVTVATDSPDLLLQTAAVFRTWRKTLAALLAHGGLTREDAVRFAATLIAATEGAVVLSRGEQSIEPFDLVAAQLLGEVRRWSRSRR